jgi:hypothetical protein
LVEGISKLLMQDGNATALDGPGPGISPNETAIRMHLTGSHFAPLT